jgi:hypothetical protein
VLALLEGNVIFDCNTPDVTVAATVACTIPLQFSMVVATVYPSLKGFQFQI